MRFLEGLLICLAAFDGFAQPRSGPSTPDTRGTTLQGGWFVRGSAPRVSGSCPPGSALMGGAHVDQTGQLVRLRFTIGFTCQPPAVCQYEGTITAGRLRLANSVVVDGEGGRVKSTLDLAIESNDRLIGTSTSTYQHPDGDSCTWTSSVEVVRKPDDGSQDPTRPNPGNPQGPGTGAGTGSATSGTGTSPSTTSDTHTPPTTTPGSGTSGTGPPVTGQNTSSPGSGSGTTTPTAPPGSSGPSTSAGTPSGSGTGGTAPPGTSPPSDGSGSGSGSTAPGATSGSSTPTSGDGTSTTSSPSSGRRRGGKAPKGTTPGPSSPTP